MKYIQSVEFNDKDNVTLYSPTTTLITETGGKSKLLVKEIEGVDTEMKIEGDSLDYLVVEKKPLVELGEFTLNVFTYNNEIEEIKHFQFEIGMTWKEFINSTYNDGKFSIVERLIVDYDNLSDSMAASYSDRNYQSENDTIIKDKEYEMHIADRGVCYYKPHEPLIPIDPDEPIDPDDPPIVIIDPDEPFIIS